MVSSLNNISHKCMSALNKKTNPVASADSSDSPVEVVSNKEHFNEIESFLGLFGKGNEFVC